MIDRAAALPLMRLPRVDRKRLPESLKQARNLICAHASHTPVRTLYMLQLYASQNALLAKAFFNKHEDFVGENRLHTLHAGMADDIGPLRRWLRKLDFRVIQIYESSKQIAGILSFRITGQLCDYEVTDSSGVRIRVPYKFAEIVFWTHVFQSYPKASDVT